MVLTSLIALAVLASSPGQAPGRAQLVSKLRDTRAETSQAEVPRIANTAALDRLQRPDLCGVRVRGGAIQVVTMGEDGSNLTVVAIIDTRFRLEPPGWMWSVPGSSRYALIVRDQRTLDVRLAVVNTTSGSSTVISSDLCDVLPAYVRWRSPTDLVWIEKPRADKSKDQRCEVIFRDDLQIRSMKRQGMETISSPEDAENAYASVFGCRPPVSLAKAAIDGSDAIVPPADVVVHALALGGDCSYCAALKGLEGLEQIFVAIPRKKTAWAKLTPSKHLLEVRTGNSAVSVEIDYPVTRLCWRDDGVWVEINGTSGGCALYDCEHRVLHVFSLVSLLSVDSP